MTLGRKTGVVASGLLFIAARLLYVYKQASSHTLKRCTAPTPILAMAYLPQERGLAYVTRGRVLEVWCVLTGTRKRSWDAICRGTITAVSPSARGRRFIVGQASGALVAISVTTGLPVAVYEGHAGREVTAVAVEGGGTATARPPPHAISLPDYAAKRMRHDTCVLVASADSDGIILVHEDGDVRARDAAMREVLAGEAADVIAAANAGKRRLSTIPGEKPLAPAASPADAARAAAEAAAAAAERAAADGRDVVRRARPIARCHTDAGRGHAPGNTITCLAISARHRLVASGGSDAAVLLWATDTGKREARFACAGVWSPGGGSHSAVAPPPLPPPPLQPT